MPPDYIGLLSPFVCPSNNYIPISIESIAIKSSFHADLKGVKYDHKEKSASDHIRRQHAKGAASVLAASKFLESNR